MINYRRRSACLSAVLLCLQSLGCPAQKAERKPMMDTPASGQNRLAKERSPYLLQHAANPVDWWPWCDEAFALARKLDKPIFVSIGYSTCHWCHVMERESFENEEVAALMNRHFVNIKVDGGRAAIEALALDGRRIDFIELNR